MSAHYTCDRCAHSIPSRRSDLVCRTGTLKERGTINLCETCSLALGAWIDGTEAPPPTPTRKRKRSTAATNRIIATDGAAP